MIQTTIRSLLLGALLGACGVGVAPTREPPEGAAVPALALARPSALTLPEIADAIDAGGEPEPDAGAATDAGPSGQPFYDHCPKNSCASKDAGTEDAGP